MPQTDKKCPPDGNIGLPIEITGSIGAELLKSITKETTTVFQFMETRTVPMSLSSSGFFDESDKHTIIESGDIYTCIGGQICSPSRQIDLLPHSIAASVAELCIWFKKKLNPLETIVVIIPIYTTNDSKYHTNPSIGQTYLQSMVGVSKYINVVAEGGVLMVERKKPKSLNQLINSFETDSAFTYMTCIDLKNGKSLSTRVLYFPGSFRVHETWWANWSDKTFETRDANNNSIKGIPPVRKLPISLYSGTETASRYGLVNSIKGPTVWSSIGLIDSGSISITDSGFTKRFSYLPIGYRTYSQAVKQKMEEDRNNAVSQYRCVRLNPGQDVVNGYVTIDPLTGKKTLDRVIEDQNSEFTQEQLKLAALDDQAAIQPGDIGKTVAIAVGITGAVVVVGWIIWNIVKRFKKDAFTPANAVTAATAAATATIQGLTLTGNTQQIVSNMVAIKNRLNTNKQENDPTAPPPNN
jgi:hypothetical protein